jgi:hypothetical protein
MGIEPGKVGANFYLYSKMKIQFNYSVEPINIYDSSDRRDMKVYTITVNKNRVSNFLAEAGQAYTGPNR